METTMNNKHQEKNITDVIQILIYTFDKDYYEIIKYLNICHQEYIPAVISELDDIINNELDDIINNEIAYAQKIEAFDMFLNTYYGEVKNCKDLKSASVHCITYLYAFLYKLISVQIFKVADLAPSKNENYSVKQKLNQLYDKVAPNKALNISLIDMLVEILQYYIVAIYISKGDNQEIFAPNNNPTQINNEELQRDYTYNISKIDHLKYLIDKNNILSRLSESGIPELDQYLYQFRLDIIQQLSRDENPNYSFINQFIILYIYYNAKYIRHNDWLITETTIEDFNRRKQTELLKLQALANQNSHLELYFALEEKLNKIFKYYLDFCILFKNSNINKQDKIIKLTSISNKIIHITTNSIIINSIIISLIGVQEQREQIFNQAISWVIYTEFNSELPEKIKFIKIWHQHLNKAELNYLLNLMTEWQADPALNYSSLAEVLNCKLVLEKHYVENLNFIEVMEYYDGMRAKTVQPPSHSRAILFEKILSRAILFEKINEEINEKINEKITNRKEDVKNMNKYAIASMPEPGPITDEDKKRKLLSSHDQKICNYAADILYTLNPHWYQSCDQVLENKNSHRKIRATNYLT